MGDDVKQLDDCKPVLQTKFLFCNKQFWDRSYQFKQTG